MFQVEFLESAAKELEKIGGELRKKVLAAIEALQDEYVTRNPIEAAEKTNSMRNRAIKSMRRIADDQSPPKDA